jgi:hypothetical protein
MGYLDNSIITVDAILTKKGRECLAKGDGSFNITQFALADDEIDYTLYNPNHPSGSAYYGEAIEKMPVLEAFADEAQEMKYKLVTLPRGTSKLPVLSLGLTIVALAQNATITITPQTLNYNGATSVYETDGYVATIGDMRVLSAFKGIGINTTEATDLNNSTSVVGTNVSKTVIGTTINLTGTGLSKASFSNVSELTTTLTVVGKNSGARMTVPVKISLSN